MSRMTIRSLAFGCLGASLFTLLPFCGGRDSVGAPILVEGAWARATPLLPGSADTPEAARPEAPVTNSAAYLVVENRTDLPDWLLGGTSPAAGAVELHESRVEDGVMRMRPVDSLMVPGPGRAELRPGGLHFMLIGLTRPLVAGDTFDLSLRFRRAGRLEIRVPVRSPGGS